MSVRISPLPRVRAILADPLLPSLQDKSRERNLRQRRAATSVRAITAARNDLLPDLAIVKRPIADLLPGKRRLRKFNLDDIVEAARAIERFGFIQPVVVGRDGCSIIDGELRMEGARWLGMEHVPCLTLSQFSKSQERALRIVLNRLGQRREWDIDVLKLELEELIIEEEDISGLGLDDIELGQILQQEELAEDAAPEPRREAPSVTRSGDLWQLGEHRLLCGDALAARSYELLMGDEQAQLLLSDPPYNIKVSTIVSTPHAEFAQGSGEMSRDEYGGFLGGFITQASERLVAGAVAFLFIDWRQVELMLETGRKAGLDLLNLIVWVKANAGMGSLYRSHHELVPMFRKQGQHKNRIKLGSRGRNRSNCWFAAGAGTIGSDARDMLQNHPTSKPVAMLADAMLDVTDTGDIVLDCFGGSGSTLIAAEQTHRRARVIELDPHYCDVILRRWGDKTGHSGTLSATGQSFEEVEKERGGEMVLETIPLGS